MQFRVGGAGAADVAGAIFGDCRRVLGGMQFGVVAQVLCCFVLLLEVLLTACKRRLELGGMHFGVLAQVRFWVLFGSGAGDSA